MRHCWLVHATSTSLLLLLLVLANPTFIGGTQEDNQDKSNAVEVEAEPTHSRLDDVYFRVPRGADDDLSASADGIEKMLRVVPSDVVVAANSGRRLKRYQLTPGEIAYSTIDKTNTIKHFTNIVAPRHHFNSKRSRTKRNGNRMHVPVGSRINFDAFDLTDDLPKYKRQSIKKQTDNLRSSINFDQHVLTDKHDRDSGIVFKPKAYQESFNQHFLTPKTSSVISRPKVKLNKVNKLSPTTKVLYKQIHNLEDVSPVTPKFSVKKFDIVSDVTGKSGIEFHHVKVPITLQGEKRVNDETKTPFKSLQEPNSFAQMTSTSVPDKIPSNTKNAVVNDLKKLFNNSSELTFIPEDPDMFSINESKARQSANFISNAMKKSNFNRDIKIIRDQEYLKSLFANAVAVNNIVTTSLIKENKTNSKAGVHYDAVGASTLDNYARSDVSNINGTKKRDNEKTGSDTIAANHDHTNHDRNNHDLNTHNFENETIAPNPIDDKPQLQSNQATTNNLTIFNGESMTSNALPDTNIENNTLNLTDDSVLSLFHMLEFMRSVDLHGILDLALHGAKQHDNNINNTFNAWDVNVTNEQYNNTLFDNFADITDCDNPSSEEKNFVSVTNRSLTSIDLKQNKLPFLNNSDVHSDSHTALNNTEKYISNNRSITKCRNVGRVSNDFETSSSKHSPVLFKNNIRRIGNTPTEKLRNRIEAVFGFNDRYLPIPVIKSNRESKPKDVLSAIITATNPFPYMAESFLAAGNMFTKNVGTVMNMYKAMSDTEPSVVAHNNHARQHIPRNRQTFRRHRPPTVPFISTVGLTSTFLPSFRTPASLATVTPNRVLFPKTSPHRHFTSNSPKPIQFFESFPPFIPNNPTNLISSAQLPREPKEDTKPLVSHFHHFDVIRTVTTTEPAKAKTLHSKDRRINIQIPTSSGDDPIFEITLMGNGNIGILPVSSNTIKKEVPTISLANMIDAVAAHRESLSDFKLSETGVRASATPFSTVPPSTKTAIPKRIKNKPTPVSNTFKESLPDTTHVRHNSTPLPGNWHRFPSTLPHAGSNRFPSIPPSNAHTTFPSSLPGNPHNRFSNSLPGTTHNRIPGSLPGHAHNRFPSTLPDHTHTRFTSNIPGHAHNRFPTSLPGHAHKTFPNSLLGHALTRFPNSLPENTHNRFSSNLPGNAHSRFPSSLPGHTHQHFPTNFPANFQNSLSHSPLTHGVNPVNQPVTQFHLPPSINKQLDNLPAAGNRESLPLTFNKFSNPQINYQTDPLLYSMKNNVNDAYENMPDSFYPSTAFPSYQYMTTNVPLNTDDKTNAKQIDDDGDDDDSNIYYIDITLPDKKGEAPIIEHGMEDSKKRSKRDADRSAPQYMFSEDRKRRLMQYTGWNPVNDRNPLNNEPTVSYKPPPLQKVHFGQDPPSTKPLYPIVPKNPPVYVVRKQKKTPEIDEVYGTEKVEYIHIEPKSKTIRAFRPRGRGVPVLKFVRRLDPAKERDLRRGSRKNINQVISRVDKPLHFDNSKITYNPSIIQRKITDLDSSLSQNLNSVYPLVRAVPVGRSTGETPSSNAAHARGIRPTTITPEQILQARLQLSRLPLLSPLQEILRNLPQIQQGQVQRMSPSAPGDSVVREVPPPNFSNKQSEPLLHQSSEPVETVLFTRSKQPIDRSDNYPDSSSPPYETLQIRGNGNVHNYRLKSRSPQKSITANRLSDLLQIFKHINATEPPPTTTTAPPPVTIMKGFRYTKPTEAPPTTTTSRPTTTHRFRLPTAFRYSYARKPNPFIQNTLTTTTAATYIPTRTATTKPKYLSKRKKVSLSSLSSKASSGIPDVTFDRVAETNSLDGYLFSDSEASPKYRKTQVKPKIVKKAVSNVTAKYAKSAKSKALASNKVSIKVLGKTKDKGEIVHRTNSRPLQSEFEVIYTKKSKSITTPKPKPKPKPETPFVIIQGHSKVSVFRPEEESNVTNVIDTSTTVSYSNNLFYDAMESTTPMTAPSTGTDTDQSALNFNDTATIREIFTPDPTLPFRTVNINSTGVFNYDYYNDDFTDREGLARALDEYGSFSYNEEPSYSLNRPWIALAHPNSDNRYDIEKYSEEFTPPHLHFLESLHQSMPTSALPTTWQDFSSGNVDYENINLEEDTEAPETISSVDNNNEISNRSDGVPIIVLPSKDDTIDDSNSIAEEPTTTESIEDAKMIVESFVTEPFVIDQKDEYGTS